MKPLKPEDIIPENKLKEAIDLLCPEKKQVLIDASYDIRGSSLLTDTERDADFVNRYIQAAARAGISNILFRSDYFSRPDPALADMFRNLLNGRKESTKCRCAYGNVSGVNVEYREVNGTLEQRLEMEGGYIRNLVLHADGRLTGGWSDESVLIRDFTR